MFMFDVNCQVYDVLQNIARTFQISFFNISLFIRWYAIGTPSYKIYFFDNVLSIQILYSTLDILTINNVYISGVNGCTITTE